MVLNEDNFLVFAMHHYQVPSCPSIEEFEADLKSVTYIKKLIQKKEVNSKLLLNHIITLFNCFGDAALYMLFYKIEKRYWGTLSTFLVYISRMPDSIPEFEYKITDLPLDEKVIKELRTL